MFLGIYKPLLIGKNRLVLPARLRKEIKGTALVLTAGFEGCIAGFDKESWERAVSPDISKPLSDTQGREMRRRLCAMAMSVDLDKAGRLVIPEEIASVIDMNKGKKDSIVVLGAGDHFEIWNINDWNEYKKKIN